MLKNITLFISLIFLSQSCVFILGGNSKTGRRATRAYTVENGAIPQEFGKNPNEIFLAIKVGRNSHDKHVYKAMETEYTGVYEFALFARLDQEKYSNKEVYRYFFHHDAGSDVPMETSDGHEVNVGNTYQQYYVYDRLMDKKYKYTIEFSQFAMAIKMYIRNLNNQRILNQGS